MNLAIAAIVILSACAQPPEAPTVQVVHGRSTPSDYMLPSSTEVEGVAAWSPLGFDAYPDDLRTETGVLECDIGWTADRGSDCQITIGIFRVPNLAASHGTNAYSHRDERAMWIDASLDGLPLMIAVAHEAGHILLNTAEHTHGGIMGGDSASLYEVDRELACRTIHICL